jgi:hypothetical protein
MATKSKTVKTKAENKLGYHHKRCVIGNIYYYNEKELLHRTDGPAYEGRYGHKEYYLNGKRHRTDGPAIEYTSGSKEYWVDGKLHRTDGPAAEYCNGIKYWYVNGVNMTEEEFNSKYGINSTLHNVKVEYEVKTVNVPKFVVIDGVKYSLAKES